MIKNKIKNSILAPTYALGLELAKTFKVSYIWGSKMAFFGISQTLAPLAGIFGVKTSSLIFIVRSITSLCITKIPLLSATFLHLPTFFGSLYLANQSRLLRSIVPLVCIIIFNLHPVGQQASLYSAYWLIPLFIGLIKPKSFLLQALGATFSTHAIGSIIWLLNNKLTAIQWNALISIVWAERLTFALILALAYYTVKYTINCSTKLLTLIKQLSYGKSSCSCNGWKPSLGKAK